MKFTCLAVAASIGLALPAFAQTPAPTSPAPTSPAPPPASATPAAPAADAASPDTQDSDGKGEIKAIRMACRDEAKTQGLKGAEKRKAISACVVKQRPDLALREQCRMDGWDKGLRKDELKSFVKDCAKGKG